MVGGSEVAVRTSIASYVLIYAHQGADAVRCRDSMQGASPFPGINWHIHFSNNTKGAASAPGRGRVFCCCLWQPAGAGPHMSCHLGQSRLSAGEGKSRPGVQGLANGSTAHD